MNLNTGERVSSVCAVLGVDMVAFSILPDDDQLRAVRCLVQWIHGALEYYEVSEQDYHWSPAGDGGYLTFKPPAASAKALDIGFAILETAHRSRWTTRTGNPIELRFGLHAGPVYESNELTGSTNILGNGINMAARILGVAGNSQMLVSSQYYDAYIRDKREKDFEFGEPFDRTVKHGMRVCIRNCCRGDLGLHKLEEVTYRGYPMGTGWKSPVESALYLVKDAIECDDPVAVLVAATFLIELNDIAAKLMRYLFAIMCPVD
jgi:class 3 adenylate cyclase